MEPVFKILRERKPELITQALAAPKEQQRFLWYTGKLKDVDEWNVTSYTEFEERLVYRESDLTLRMGKNLFPSYKSRKGFSFDKQTKKITLWYGSTPATMTDLTLLLVELRKEWVVRENISTWLTKGLLEKILADKITNPRDAVNYIIKSLRFKNIEPKALQKYIKDGGTKNTLLQYVYHVEDIRLFLESPSIYGSYLFKDTLKQAKILDQKIKLSWSSKRLTEVHKDWTREIMRAELDMLEPEFVHYKYEHELMKLLPPNFELIRDRKRLFMEGAEMDHCVYTNYWDEVKSKWYMVIHIEQEDELAVTAGIRIMPWKSDNTLFRLDQVLGLRNSVFPTEKTNTQLKTLIESAPFIEVMTKEFSKIQEEIEEKELTAPVLEEEETEFTF